MRKRSSAWMPASLKLVFPTPGAHCLLCALSLDLTLDYFLEQARWLTHPWYLSVSMDWWKYTQTHLFGYDIDPRMGLSSLWTGSLFGAVSAALFLATSFIAGALGIYFLQLPPKIPACYLVLAIVLSAFLYRGCPPRRSVS
jgi:hypothetical protein